jgi:hypothetical protein
LGGWGSELGVWILWCGVRGSGFEVRGAGLRFQDLGFWVLGFRFEGSGILVSGSGIRASGLRFRVWVSENSVYGSGLKFGV